MLREFFYRINALFHRSSLDQEMDEEMQYHLERETEENLRRGMNPEDARHRALRNFGGILKV